MIVIIEDDVFRDTSADLQLLSIFRWGLDERHHVRTDPVFESGQRLHANRWFERQPLHLQQMIEQVFENHEALETTGAAPRPGRRIRVASIGRASWDSAPPRLPIADACRLLEMPLRLLVENRRNDAAFVRAFANPVLRERLRAAEEEGWTEFVQGGGLPELLHRVQEEGRDRLRAMRLWVLFDSDARAPFDRETQAPVDPGIPPAFGPSPTSRAVVRACTRARGVCRWHQLARRSIENYMPGRGLQAWARGRGERAHKVDRFIERMTPTQRRYFNMKDGFDGDRRSQLGVSPIYDDAVGQDRYLATGFKGIADLYHDLPFEHARLGDDQLDELGPVIASIFENM